MSNFESEAERLKAVLLHPYAPNNCFLCATPLSDQNGTVEHVFPKWLQHRFNLWEKHLTLLNGTTISYRRLTIPCCKVCNNDGLAPIEKRIEEASKLGFEMFSKLSRFELIQWLGKIFVGIQFKELSLAVDRTDPNSEKILTPEFLQRYAMLHFWLQMQAPHDWHPGSLWIFECQCPEETDLQFDLKDDALNGFIALRFGEIGIIGDFFENGVHQKVAEPLTAKLANKKLHPHQFTEVVARLAYGASLLCQESDIQFFQDADGHVSYRIEWRSTVDGDSCMNPWHEESYASVLSQFTGIPFDQIHRPEHGTMGWLFDANNTYVPWMLNESHPLAGQVRPILK